MRVLRFEFLIDVVWLAFAGGYCAVAATYPPGGRLVPLTIGLIGLAIGIIHFCGNFLAVLRPYTHGDTAVEEPSAETGTSELKAIGWAVILLAGIFLIGALPAIFLFFLFYFALRGRRWGLGVVSAIIMTAAVWALFGQLMQLELPVGYLTALGLGAM